MENDSDQKQWKVFRGQLWRDSIRRGIVPPPLNSSIEKNVFKQWQKGEKILKKLLHGL